MFRISGLFFVLIAVIAGTLLFQTSQSVQRVEGDLLEVKKGAENEKESLRILGAEWDYLNRPERLEKLTLQNLDMDAAHAEKTDFIPEGEGVPEPELPVIPSVKPEGIFLQASLHNGKASDVERAEIIRNLEKENFDALIETKTGEEE